MRSLLPLQELNSASSNASEIRKARRAFTCAGAPAREPGSGNFEGSPANAARPFFVQALGLPCCSFENCQSARASVRISHFAVRARPRLNSVYAHQKSKV